MPIDYKWNTGLSRDRHLMPGGPKRLLALDGGGIRGLVTLGILQRIEDILKARLPEANRPAFRLAHYYDFIGGTSTGSIIAAWLALGKDVASLRELYMTMGKRIFSNPVPLVVQNLFISRFDARALEAELRAQLKDQTLDTPELVTGLGVTAKRMDTGSGWVIANNPKARFWDRANNELPSLNFFPNKDMELVNIVRASAAAPAYFDHVRVPIEPVEPNKPDPAAFMDGAVAGYNNPSAAFFLYTTVKGYGLSWETGADRLLITSVGTGEYRQKLDSPTLRKTPAIKQAILSLAGSIADVGKSQMLLMQALGRPLHAWPMNMDVDNDTIADFTRPHPLGRSVANSYTIVPEPLFSFQRYDAPLERDTLRDIRITEDNMRLGPRVIRDLQKMDCVTDANLARLRRIGERAGEVFVQPEHFPDSFNTAGMSVAAPAPQPEAKPEGRGLFGRRRRGRR